MPHSHEPAAYIPPPPGWFSFGTHIDEPGPLEFSAETDEGGMPLWERPAPTDPILGPIVESIIVVTGDQYRDVVESAEDIGGSTWAVVEVLLGLQPMERTLEAREAVAEQIVLSDLRRRWDGPLHEVVHGADRYWLRADHICGVYELHRLVRR